MMGKMKTVLFLLLLPLVAVLVGYTSQAGAAQPTGESEPPFATVKLPPAAQSAPLLPATAVKPATKHPKLDATLAAIATAAESSPTQALNLAASQQMRLSGERLHVQIITHAPALQAVAQAIAEAGGEVTGTGNSGTLIQGWLPVAALPHVASLDDVYMIRRPATAVLLETGQIADTTTEALAVINGPAWHAAGQKGAGVKVGVIDGGFQGYTTLLGTDLPAAVVARNFVDGEGDAQVDGTTAHGTACAEIVHDIAPEAQLYLAKVNTNVDLAEAVNWLIAQNVDIISTSLGWYNVSPGDGTGEFADLVDHAQANGILWITAAGNDRQAHWGGSFADPGGNQYHNFNGTQEVNYFGPGDGTAYLINPGVALYVFVRWDDWSVVDQDYDLYILRWNGDAGQWEEATPLISGTRVQNGGPGQTPTEVAAIVTGAPAAPYGFVLYRYDSDRSVNFEIFAPKIGRLDEVVHARSLANLADAPQAVTVAALDVNAPYPQESYSSEGPTNGAGGTASGGLIKPDMAAYANVSAASWPSKFNGTSAATPHVAGAAALLLGANSSYTPQELEAALVARAVDMGSTGKDTLFGHGRLHLGPPPLSNTPPAFSDIPGQGLFTGESADNAVDLWVYAHDEQDSDAALSFAIVNSPDPAAGVTLDSGRYIDINPTPTWTGTTSVEVRVEDSEGLSATTTFNVLVIDPVAALYLPLSVR